MKKLNHEQIIKINALKFKKIIRMTTSLKPKSYQIKSRLTTQKRLFNSRSIYKNVLEYLYVTLEDDKRFHTYFKKRFPKSFKYLPIVKFVSFLVIFITLKIDYQTYSVLSSTPEESLIVVQTKLYSPYSFCFYFVTIIYQLLLSVYVTLKANSPVKHAAFQIAKHTAKAMVSSSVVAVGYSHASDYYVLTKYKCGNPF